MRLIFGVLRDRPAESGASNPPTFTPHSLSHPLFGVLYLWRHRLGDIVSSYAIARHSQWIHLRVKLLALTTRQKFPIGEIPI